MRSKHFKYPTVDPKYKMTNSWNEHVYNISSNQTQKDVLKNIDTRMKCTFLLLLFCVWMYIQYIYVRISVVTYFISVRTYVYSTLCAIYVYFIDCSCYMSTVNIDSQTNLRSQRVISESLWQFDWTIPELQRRAIGTQRCVFNTAQVCACIVPIRLRKHIRIQSFEWKFSVRAELTEDMIYQFHLRPFKNTCLILYKINYFKVIFR